MGVDQQEDNPQNVAQVPQLSPTSFSSFSSSGSCTRSPICRAVSAMFCECGVDGIGIGNGDGYTLSPMRGCFARGCVVSLSCVGFDAGSNAGKKMLLPIPLLAVTGSQPVSVRHAQSVNLDVSPRLLKEEFSVC